MTEALIEDQHQEAAWVEMEPIGTTSTVSTKFVGTRLDTERSANTCRCWRCSGAPTSLAERGPLDRILARHLLRMTEVEREDWLRQWSLVPSHSPQDIRTLQDWIAIEQGKNVPEPKYLAGRAG